jgi:predicted MFS family arabinose efflux permease
MGFGASQVLGIPISLFIANRWSWQSPFLMVAILAALILFIIIAKLKPITKHLSIERDKTPIMHLWHTLTNSHYSIGFVATALLSIGGFMMMPFGSAFAINNLKITQEQLPFLFMISGVCSLIIMPVIGRVSDKIDKFKVFAVAAIWTMVMVAVYTNLFAVPFWLIIVCNVLLMMGIMSRIIPATALVSGIPTMADRGAFMSINSSLQQIAGGIAAVFAGTIVVQKDKVSPIEHYNTLGYIMIGITVISIFATYRVSALVKKRGAN